MAENLTNKHIYETYHSLIKTGDNGPIDGNLKVLSDGDGNELPIEVSTDTTKFKEGSTADFTDVTIIGAAGMQGPQGPQGTNGIDGTQGPQGPQGINGVDGAQGAQGTNGVNGAQGAQGPQGTNGVNGAQGAQGPQGTNGTDGAQGAQGTNGVDGAQGAQGPQGFQGSVGGVAINDVTPGAVHTGNTLETIIDTILVPANTVKDGDIFNYLARIGGTKVVSNNTTIRAYVNTSAVIGGQALVSTGTIIPTTSVQGTINRYFYVNQANGTGLGTQVWNANGPNENVSSPINYIQAAINWTVDQYIVLTGQLSAPTNSVSCPGATFFNTAGAAGPQGPQGPGVGAQGAQGPQGPQGFQGNDSIVPGPQGPQGPQGVQGVQGPLGPQGVDGAQGATGAQGPQGVDGSQGLTGPQGVQGDQGADSTVPGPQGTQGPQGPSGGGSSLLNQPRRYGTGSGSNSSNDGPYAFFNNVTIFYPLWIDAGAVLDSFDYIIRTVFTGGALNAAIYNVQIPSTNVGITVPFQKITPNYVLPNNVTGFQLVDVPDFTFPYSGQYYLAINVPSTWDGAFQSVLTSQGGLLGNAAAQNNSTRQFINTGQTDRFINTWRQPDGLLGLQAQYPNNVWTNTSSSIACFLLRTK